MDSETKNFGLEQIASRIEEKEYALDYTYQRSEGQWSLEQKSLLIDSYIKNFPVDGITVARKKISDTEYSLTEYFVIDGVQRSTTICDFINNRMALSKNMPAYDGHELAGKYYNDLDDYIKRLLGNYQQSVVVIKQWTPEELKEVFKRKNNGKPLTKAQKLSVFYNQNLMDEIGNITKLNEMDANGKPVKNFWQRVISNSTHKNAEDRTLVMQAIMLIDKKMYIDANGKKTNLLQSGFSSDDMENYINQFLSYTADEQNALIEAVSEASEKLTEHFSTYMDNLEAEIATAKADKRAAKKADKSADVSVYDGIIKANGAKLKSIKKLTIPMLVAGMAKAINQKTKDCDENYMDSVYGLLDFLVEHSKRTEAEREEYEAVNTEDAFLYYYHNYNTQATASIAKVNGRWNVFKKFATGSAFVADKAKEETDALLEEYRKQHDKKKAKKEDAAEEKPVEDEIPDIELSAEEEAQFAAEVEQAMAESGEASATTDGDELDKLFASMPDDTNELDTVYAPQTETTESENEENN